MTTPRELTAALAPLREVLLRAARVEVARIVSNADASAHSAIATAEDQARDCRNAARQAGIADAADAIARDRARSRRAARTAELHADREVYQGLRTEVRMAAERIAAGDKYPALRATLVAAARRQLGSDAETVDIAEGGIVATAGNRRVDLSLALLADRAADAVAGRLVQP
jgi:hypothetical protein